MEEWRPEILVLGPGGIKGFLELGFLFPVEASGALSKVHTYAGVSVGAMISLLIVSGFTVKEIVAEAIDADIFMDVDSIRLGAVISNSGLISNEPIKQRLSRLIVSKFGYVPTLRQLNVTTGLTFVSITYNMDKHETERIDHITCPDTSCVDAVMLSMNIPLLFYRLVYGCCTYADGALGNPYPVNLFDRDGAKVLGVYIDEVSAPISEAPIYTYIQAIIQAPLRELRKLIIKHSSNNCRHVRLETPNVGVSASPTEKGVMIYRGFVAGKLFLSELNQASGGSPLIIPPTPQINRLTASGAAI